MSFLGALMNAAQLGLEPNTPLGQAYLIPYAFLLLPQNRHDTNRQNLKKATYFPLASFTPSSLALPGPPL